MCFITAKRVYEEILILLANYQSKEDTENAFLKEVSLMCEEEVKDEVVWLHNNQSVSERIINSIKRHFTCDIPYYAKE